MRHKAVLFLWLLAPLAWAQEVVVFEFQADAGQRLGKQIENALWEHAKVLPMPRQTYANEALRAGITNAQTAQGFSQVAPRLKTLSVAVWGKVEGDSVEIFIWDKAGAQLWSRPLPLQRGLLTRELSQRLAKAIAAAVEVQKEGETKGEKKEAQEARPAGSPPPVAAGSPPPVAAVVAPPPAPPKPTPEGVVSKPPPAVTSEPPESEVLRPQLVAFQAPFLRLALLGSLSWRSMCVRPGSPSCVALEKLPADGPQGNKDFSSGAYGGFSLQAEVFPLALLTSSLWKGLGVRLEMGYGRVKRDFVDIGAPEGPGVALPTTILRLEEVHGSAEALYRYFILEPQGEGMAWQVSASLGYAGKRFSSKDILSQGFALPDIRRGYLSAGIDTELSLWPFLRLSLCTQLFIQPRPGKEVVGKYEKVSSTGYRLGGAVSGAIYGPLGYKVDVSWSAFKDSLKGASQEEGVVCESGTCNGSLRESYFALRGGLLLEF